MAKGRDLMEKIREEHEKMLRAAADLENYKKRAKKENEEVQKFGNEKLLKDFLPVLDNLDRALEHAKLAPTSTSLRKGVEMIRKLFEDTLGKHGVKAFTAVGQALRPELPRGDAQVETDEMPAEPRGRPRCCAASRSTTGWCGPALVMVSKAEAPEAARRRRPGAVGDPSSW